MTLFGGYGPGRVFRHLAVRGDADAQNVVANRCDLLAGISRLDLDAIGKRRRASGVIEDQRCVLSAEKWRRENEQKQEAE